MCAYVYSQFIIMYFFAANSFIYLVEYLFTFQEVKENNLSFLSFTLCQDPLEGFFGCQKQRGGTSENPNIKEFYHNTATLRVVNSFCRNSTTGVCIQLFINLQMVYI